MATITAFADPQLEAICKILADTSKGLTGSQIDELLRRQGITNCEPGATKWRRLYAALHARQRQDRCGNNVAALIHAAMEPVSYAGRQVEFDDRRAELNPILAFCGLTLGEDGKLSPATAAKTLSEAEERAGRLRTELQRRRVHPEVLRFCRAELLQNNYFHAVFEATKSVAEKIRQMSGLNGDGAPLVQQALAPGRSGVPRIAFNSLRTKTERDEQLGLTNLTIGMFGAFRNVTAHAPKITWPIREEDALDLLSLASLLHRRLDDAVVVRQE